MQIKQKYIHRIDQDSRNLHGWRLRIRNQLLSVSNFFADKDFMDDTRSSLQEAINYRDKLLETSGISKSITTQKRKLKAVNSLGIVGMTKDKKRNFITLRVLNNRGKLITRRRSLNTRSFLDAVSELVAIKEKIINDPER